jgi:hypothetical protein
MTYLLIAALVLAPTEAQLLHGVGAVESRNQAHAPDGDLDKPLCQRSRGQYQVRPIAVRELVRVGALAPMPGFSLTSCGGIRAWLAVPANNRKAATLYLRLMLERSNGDIESALCRYNGGRKGCIYAGQVLQIATGEGP